MATKRKLSKRPSRKGKRLHGKAQDPVQVAAILAFASKENVVEACKRFGVADRTVRRYKARVESGNWPEVAELLKSMRQEAFDSCADVLTEAYRISLKRVIELVPKATIDQAIKAGEMCGQMKLTRDAMNEPDSNNGSGKGAS